MSQGRTQCTSLRPGQLYIGENGRIHCHQVQCAGATAACTGIDLDGRHVMRVSDAIAAIWQAVHGPMRCDSCGARRA